MSKSRKAKDENPLKHIIAHAKEYGFVFQSSEIYDGLQAVYDYGPWGVELKNNLKRLWWKAMTQLRDDIVGLDAAIFMAPQTWKASGHVDSFNDPMIDNKDSKKRYRADVLIEEKAAQYEAKGEDQKARALLERMATALSDGKLDQIGQLILEEEIVCPESGTGNWTDVRQFNLMFSTEMGSVADESSNVYLRPETAQGIFVNFLNVQKASRMNIPFGIAQIGKAFRNEIVARQFIFRMREFEQMEMQFFVRPGTEMDWYHQWKAQRRAWHKALGFKEENLRWHDHENLAHYANAATDIEYQFPFGFKEMEGIHSRTDFDLSRHAELSKKKHNYFDNEINQSYIPYVVETSIGADRLFLAMLAESYVEETINDGEKVKERKYLKLPPFVAPVKAAIMPIVRKDGLPEKARAIFNDLKFSFNCVYEEKGGIGKLYTRQDLIGTPFCIAVDYETLENDTVTIRSRDTMAQVRLSINELKNRIEKDCSDEVFLKSL